MQGLAHISLQQIEMNLANAFLSYHEKNWLNNCPQGFKPVFYRRYVDDIFILFKSNDHLKYFQDFLNSCHINMSFSMETEKENNYPFLTLKLCANKVNLQPQFTENLLTLVYRCFRICSNWTQFHNKLIFLKGIFQKNGYPKNFTDKCFKKLLNNVHLIKENV